MLESLTLEVFSRLIGEPFRFHLESAVVETELKDARDLTEHAGPHAVGRPRVPFSIHFIGPADEALGQGTYIVEHAELGRFDLFIVPLGPHQDGLQYEAIFT